jgi:hypothetical protein
MRYLVLIYGSEQQWASKTPEAIDAIMAQYFAYSQALADAGVMRGGSELQPTFTATTIRVRGGEVQTTDGPFAETKEQLGGYYLLETETLDEALRWAAKCPGAADGCVEVRPIVERPAKASDTDALAGAAQAE